MPEKDQSQHKNDEPDDHGNVLSLVLEQDGDEKEKEDAPDRGAHLNVGHHYRNEEYQFGNCDVVDLRDNHWPAIAARQSTGITLLYSHATAIALQDAIALSMLV